MITRLTLIDFMAHARTEFALAPGLNVLTGPNNTGKSAVVEALRCLAENPPPRHVIRHGAAEARVVAETDDGTTIAWVRRPKYALYELTRPGAAEPEVYAKFGRTPPEAVLAALRLNPVPIEGGEAVDVHIGNQREPVFLLNRPGTVLAGFFAASTEAAHLIAMQNLLTDRARKSKTEKGRLEKRLAGIAAGIDRLAPLPDIELRLETAAGIEAGLAVREEEAAALAAGLAARDRLAGRMAALAGTRAALAPLAGPPALSPTTALAALSADVGGLAGAVRHAAGRDRALAALAEPPRLFETSVLAGRLAGLDRARQAVAGAAGRAAALAELAAPPIVADVAALAAMLARLSADRARGMAYFRKTAALSRLAEPPRPAEVATLAADIGLLDRTRAATAALARKNAGLARLAAPPETRDVGPLGELLDALDAAKGRLAKARAAHEAKSRALAKLARGIEARLAELGACPLCGGELSAADFLGRGHNHAPKADTP